MNATSRDAARLFVWRFPRLQVSDVAFASVITHNDLLEFYVPDHLPLSLPLSLSPSFPLNFASSFLSPLPIAPRLKASNVFSQSDKSKQTWGKPATTCPPSLPPSGPPSLPPSLPYCSNADKVTLPTNRFLNEPNSRSPVRGCRCISDTKGVRPEGSCNTRNKFPSRDKMPPSPYFGMKV